MGKKELIEMGEASPINVITDVPLAICVVFAKPAFIKRADWFHLQMKKQKYNEEEKIDRIDRFGGCQAKENRNRFSAISSTAALLRAV